MDRYNTVVVDKKCDVKGIILLVGHSILRFEVKGEKRASITRIISTMKNFL